MSDRLNAAELQRRIRPRPGGQGVAGSNPAVPTGRLRFSNMLCLMGTSRRANLLRNGPSKACAATSYQGTCQRQSQRSRLVKESEIAEPRAAACRIPSDGVSNRL
jgi:hypothetical protein